MRKNMSILRYQQTQGKPHKALSHASLAKLKKLPLPAYKFIPETIACLLFFTMVSAMAADLRGRGSPQINLLEEFRPIGDSGNNLENPDLDVVPGSPEIALAPLNFAPRTDDGLVNGPNPRTISNVISGGTGTNGVNGQTTDPTASAWLYVFGQFVDHDLDLEATPLTTPAINIVVPPGDPVFPPGTSILMTRATRSPETNTIINTVAGYLDLSQLYGSTAAIAASLRNADGTLASSGNGQYLPVVNGSFVSGDVRVMENPELTAVTTLFMREHNFWVRILKAQYPGWTGNQLYNMAKAITTAEYQNIVYTEYLPTLIGPVLGPYRGYSPNIDAQVTQEFSTAAFRLHTQISDTQEGLDNNGSVVFTEPLAQSFFNTAAIDESNGINPLIRSLGVDFAQATDVYVVAALRNLLFENLVGGGIDAMDLIAIDIQRERDVGLGTLNQTRRALGLEPYDSFADLTPDPILQKYLQAVYGNINNVDLFIGGLAEVHVPGSRVGPTFQAIFTRQFQALRAGDRFFWMNEGFNDETTEMIANTTLADIILRNTDTTALQANVFIETPLPIPVAPNVTAPLAAHVQPHVPTPAVIDTHGRTGSPFIGDGW
jgi:peroxidase